MSATALSRICVRVTAVDDVLGRLREGGRQVGVTRGSRSEQRERSRLIEEEPLFAALLPTGGHLSCLLGGGHVPGIRGDLAQVLRVEREREVVHRRIGLLAGRADAPLPGPAADLGAVAEVRRRQRHAILDLVEAGGVPDARPDHRRLAVGEVRERVDARLLGDVALVHEAPEPGGPLLGRVAVEDTLGGLETVAVDQVATKALQERRVAVGPPLGPAVAGAKVKGVVEVTGGLDLLQRGVELLAGPGLLDAGDPDAGLGQGVLVREDRQSGLEVADRVQLVLVDPLGGLEVLRDQVLREIERLKEAGLRPGGDVGRVDIEDAGKLLRRCSGRDRPVVRLLGERLELDGVLVLARVVVLDDRLQQSDLLRSSTSVGPYLQRVGVATATAGLHTATGGDEADRRCGGDGLEKHSGPCLAHGSS